MAILEIRNVTRRFGDLLAFDDASSDHASEGLWTEIKVRSR